MWFHEFFNASFKICITSISSHFVVFIFKNVSNCCRHKDDQPISRVFSDLIFGGFLQFGSKFVHGPSVKELNSAQGPFCSVYLFSVTLLKRFTFPWNLFAHNHWSEKKTSQETMTLGFDEKTFDSLKSLVRKWPVRNWQSLWQTAATPVD